MKLNKILLGCLLFTCAANSGELKLESTTGGDYFKVKSTECIESGIILSFIETKETKLFHCNFTITAKQEIKVLKVKINKNIPEKLNKCDNNFIFRDLSKSDNPMTDKVVDQGETIHYNIKCTSSKNPIKTITITTDKNEATYKI